MLLVGMLIALHELVCVRARVCMFMLLHCNWKQNKYYAYI